jgi:ATP-binding cassette, subfamily D (ALD), peroxisomal long-chain fatty acid import protein
MQYASVTMANVSTLRNSNDPLGSLLAAYIQLSKTRWRKTSRPTQLIATLLFVLSILAGGYSGKKWFDRRAIERAQAKRLLRRNSGLRGRDGERIIFVPYRDSSAKVVIHPTKTTTFDAHRRLFLNPPRAARLGDVQATLPQAPPPLTKPGLNLAFLHQFLSLMSIMTPHWNSKESGLLLSQGLFLMFRTYLSLVVARLDGELVRDLVAGHGKAFLWGIVKWCGIGGKSGQVAWHTQR